MALSASRARVLAAVSSLGGAGGRPVTLAELAGALGGHPNTSRQHLDALVASGLLDARDVARASSGRRPRGYTLSDAGRRSLAPAGEDGYREIVEAVVAHHVAAGRGPDEAHQIGEAWGEQRASALPPSAGDDPVGAVTELLGMLGFDPAPMADGFLLRSCPLLGIAQKNQEFACTLHEGMVRGVIRRVGGRQVVRLRPFAHPHGCQLSFGEPDDGMPAPPDAPAAR